MRHPLFERFAKIEGLVDKLTLALIVVLGLTMAIGLATATGHVTW